MNNIIKLFKIIAIILSFIFFLLIIYLKFTKKKPLGYIKKKKIIIKHKKKNYKDNYSINKVPKKIDAIVIGSGLSGLSTAAFLARVGKTVLVLEKNNSVGIQNYNGYEFTKGMHSIGFVNPIKYFLNYITLKKIKFVEIGKENNYFTDEIFIGKLQYKIRSGKNDFINDLIHYFPKEKKAIYEYIRLVDDATSDFHYYFISKAINNRNISKLYTKFNCKKIFKYINIKTYDILKSITKNKDLIALLCCKFATHDNIPTESMFFFHAISVKCYFNGSYYPVGGLPEIIKNIIPVIESSGGRVLVNQGVKNIIFKNGKAIGIKTENNDKIYSNIIISSVGFKNTFKKLIKKKKYIPRQIINKMKELNNSYNYIRIYIGINEKKSNIKLKSNFIWSIPSNNIKKSIIDFNKDPENAPIPLVISSSSSKDKKWSKRHKKSVITILCFLGNKSMKKVKKNKNFNKVFIDRVINEYLYLYFPNLIGLIDYSKIEFHKNMFGILTDKHRFSKDDYIIPNIDIQNLYLTGQDITLPSYYGALASGFITANSILGYGSINSIITKRDFFTDLNNLL